MSWYRCGVGSSKNKYITPTILGTEFTQTYLLRATASFIGNTITLSGNTAGQYGEVTYTSTNFLDLDLANIRYLCVAVTETGDNNQSACIWGTIYLINEAGTSTTVAAFATWNASNSSSKTTLIDLSSLALPSGKYKIQFACRQSATPVAGYANPVSHMGFNAFMFM